MEVKQIRSGLIQSEIDTTLVDEVARRYIDAAVAKALELLIGKCVEKNDRDFNKLKAVAIDHSSRLNTISNILVTDVVRTDMVDTNRLHSGKATIHVLNADNISSFTTESVEAASVNAMLANIGEAVVSSFSARIVDILGGNAVLQSLVSDIISSDVLESKTINTTDIKTDYADINEADVNMVKAVHIDAHDVSASSIESRLAVIGEVEAVGIEASTVASTKISAEHIETSSIMFDTINGIDSAQLSKAVSILGGNGLITVKDGKVHSILPKDLLNHADLSNCEKDTHKQYLNLNGRGELQSVEGDVAVLNDLYVGGSGRHGSVHCYHLHTGTATVDKLKANLAKYGNDEELMKSGDGAIGFIGSSLKYVSGGQLYSMATKTSASVSLTNSIKSADGSYLLKGLRVNPMSCIIQVKDMSNGGAIVGNADVYATETMLKIKLPYESSSCVALLLEV